MAPAAQGAAVEPVLARFAAQLSALLAAGPGEPPFAAADDRAAWTALPADARAACVAAGKGHLDCGWQGVRARDYLTYIRHGRQTDFLDARSGRRAALAALVLAECVEAEGRFLEAIADGIWAICEESYWGNPGALYIQAAGRGFPDPAEPIVELGTGETASLLAWSHHLLGARLDGVSALLRQRLEHELRVRVLDVCLARDDFWWMGFTGVPVNNWTPWVSGNWLTTVLLIEADPQRRVDAVSKILRSLDIFLAAYADDGGCDEGPGYWNRAGASLLECLELLHHATAGGIDVFEHPKIGAIARFPVHMQIADGWFVNFADAPAQVQPCASLIHAFGERLDDPGLRGLGAWAARSAGDGLPAGPNAGLARQLHALFRLERLRADAAQPPYPRASWFPGIQVLSARDRAGSTAGLFVAAKGGTNAESHNHNDVGNVVIYVDGAPVLVDVGVETYTAKTFSDERYEIWTMRSGYHNLPEIGGCQQLPARRYLPGGVKYTDDDARAARDVACQLSPWSARFSADIAGCYPASAGVESWRREVILECGDAVVVEDRFALAAPQAVVLTWMTPCAVEVEAADDGVCRLRLGTRQLARGTTSGTATLTVEGPVLRATVERIELQDPKLCGTWGEALFRVRLAAVEALAAGIWRTTVRGVEVRGA